MPAKDVMGGKPSINASAIKGDSGTGFEKSGVLGEFACYNCKFYKHDTCNQKDMVKLSKQPRTKNGLVVVGDFDCCEYVTRMSRPIKKRKE